MWEVLSFIAGPAHVICKQRQILKCYIKFPIENIIEFKKITWLERNIHVPEFPFRDLFYTPKAEKEKKKGFTILLGLAILKCNVYL